MTHAGCSLKLILDWAWDRVVDIKDQLDQLCKNFILDGKGVHCTFSKNLVLSLEMLLVAIGNIRSGQKAKHQIQLCNLEEPLFEL